MLQYEMILGTLQTLVVVVGAIWTYWRFFHEGAHKPRIEFDLECDFHGPQQGYYIVAFRLQAINQGRIEHQFDGITLRIRGIASDEGINEWQGREPLAYFPHKKFEENIIPERMKYFFVRPGVQQRFSYVTRVPATWSILLAQAEFKYKESRELHTAERAFTVTTPDIDSKSDRTAYG
ncbi:hypothetical protein NC796_13880 [Aliifodinibius sp. S!AR15-10]|uniref:hypothetical protein n=1 Tax=Aliifodinibius sp. S!AR15-10 TaxID=2950437 RepID=UPI0028641869|nr:hypothetical protein [Aliifodinibius sp. S!AR15-10]MDR8392238.1 hypothetical protein [Aliifodinibius sp. S!AR15-10]